MLKTTGQVEAICISEKKGIVKHTIDEAEFREDWGIVGDAHAGHWHRQVSLLAGESIDDVKKTLPEIVPGSFAENIISRGIDITNLKIGEILYIGDSIILEVTQIGKECHISCAIGKATGECIMPKQGVFARVVQGGVARAGDVIKVKTNHSA